MRALGRLLLALTALGLPSQVLGQSLGLRVACFSPQRVFAESSEGKAVIARLSTLRDEKTRAIEEKNDALQARERALEQSSSLLSESARTQRTNDVQKFRVDVQRFIEDAQAELLRIQRDAEGAFLVRLKPAVAKVAQDKGLQVVFNADDSGIVWFDPMLDITSDVVKQIAAR
jgi:Skp family chaperone for outer membrane proteins